MANWIKKAVKPENKGKFAAKAKAAGYTTREYAEKEAHAPGKLGQEARFAKNAMSVQPHKKRGLPYKHRKES
jgi:hypothetical protein